MCCLHPSLGSFLRPLTLGLVALTVLPVAAQSRAPVRSAAPSGVAAPFRSQQKGRAATPPATSAPKTRTSIAPAGDAGKVPAGDAGNAPAGPIKFELPANANAERLVDFLAEMITFVPQSKEQAEEYQRVAPELMNQAARKVQQLERDKTSDNYLFASKYLLAVEAMTVHKATPQRQQEMFNQIKQQLSSQKFDSDDLDIAITFAETLEMAGETKKAYAAYREFSILLSKAEDTLARELSVLMAGAARRLNLIGNPIEVSGTALNGRPIDWQKYRGKVVLIDFWATWCGPCLQELPNVRKAYEAYHRLGFEVVGVNMDEDRARLDAFLQKNPMPWATLHEKEGAQPTAVRYGISALPTSILVGRDGKVISTDARGEALEKELEKLFHSDNLARKPGARGGLQFDR